jgi:hypothetical protein
MCNLGFANIFKISMMTELITRGAGYDVACSTLLMLLRCSKDDAFFEGHRLTNKN